MGGAQAIAALAYGTEPRRPRRRDRRPRQPVRPGGQAPALAVTSASTASPAPATCSWPSPARRGRGRSNSPPSTCSPRPSTGRPAWCVAASSSTEVCEALAGRARAAGRWSGPTVADAAFGIVAVPGRPRGDRARQRLRPRAPAADRRRARAAGPARHERRLPVRRPGQRDRLRRLRRGLQPRAPDRRCGPLRLRPLAASLPAHDDRGEDRRRRRPSSPPPAPRSPAPRASRCTPSRWRPGS